MSSKHVQHIHHTISHSVDFQVYATSEPDSTHVDLNVSGAYGGGGSYTIDFEIPLDIEVIIDDKADLSAAHCAQHIVGLSSEVETTKAVQTAGIYERAERVGSAISQGFFQLVSSDLSQQINELKQRVDSQLMHLQKLSERLLGIRQQMHTDYQRLSERYTKLFGQLNEELSSRIYRIDQPIFELSEATARQHDRLFATGASASTLATTETSRLEGLIHSSYLRQEASQLLDEAQGYLSQSLEREQQILRCRYPQEASGYYYLPVHLIEHTSPSTQELSTQLASVGLPEGTDLSAAQEALRNAPEQPLQPEVAGALRARLQEAYPGDDAHSVAVRERILQLFQQHTLNP